MQFLIIRQLTKSELGLFGEYRRQGRETSRQRGINFDAHVVERVFPSAIEGRDIVLNLRFRGDAGICNEIHPLKKQARNWRLVGEKIDDKCFGIVDPGDLFLLTINAIGPQPECTFTIVKPDSKLANRVLSCTETTDLGRNGMIAIHNSESEDLESYLLEYDTELFGGKDIMEPRTSYGPSDIVESESITDQDLVQLPDAARMIDIVAGIGYDLNVAVADLIDNSISAGAQNIEIVFPDPSLHGRMLAISDDGSGMTPRQLVNALRFGVERDYHSDDLGKYGIGLKSASLSQARAVIVSSKTQNEKIEILGWDKREVRNTGAWKLTRPNLDKVRTDLLQRPLKHQHGTVVFWDDMIPPQSNRHGRGRAQKRDNISSHGLELQQLSRHLGKVFHRFIEGKARGRPKLVIQLNGTEIEAWDPLRISDEKTQPLRTESINIPGADNKGHQVEVHAAIVAGSTEFENKEDRDRAGYWGNWQQAQGFYFYRNDRIIQDGGWCNLWIEDPHYQLLRVAIDLNSALDKSFGINVAKMNVHPPAVFMTEIKSILTPHRAEAKRRYSPAGRKNKKKASPRIQSDSSESNVSNNSSAHTTASATPIDNCSSNIPEGLTSTNFFQEHKENRTLISAVPLGGTGWRCRTDAIGNEIVELDTQLPSAQALHTATATNPAAAEALKKLLKAIDTEENKSAVISAWSVET